MRTFIGLLSATGFLLTAACDRGGPAAPSTPTPTPIKSMSRPIKIELDKRVEAADPLFHAGCRDEEKSACRYGDAICAKNVEARMRSAVAKKAIAVEWEEPRLTWNTIYGATNQYWFVNKDGSGTHYWLVPSPDETTKVCGETWCGWHKEDVEEGTLLADGKFHLKPYGADEPISDMNFCPDPPPQPNYGSGEISFE